MLRTFAVLVVLSAVAGCGDTRGAREVPVSSRREGTRPVDPNAVTRPARAIATH